MKIVKVAFSILLIPLMVFAGCDNKENNTEDTIGLEGVVWILELYGMPDNLKTVLTGTEITAKFNSIDGYVIGSGGCNTYGGKYELSENKLTITDLQQTLIGCGEEKNQQEEEFLAVLKSAENFQIDDGKLTINCSGAILIFRQE